MTSIYLARYIRGIRKHEQEPTIEESMNDITRHSVNAGGKTHIFKQDNGSGDVHDSKGVKIGNSFDGSLNNMIRDHLNSLNHGLKLQSSDIKIKSHKSNLGAGKPNDHGNPEHSRRLAHPRTYVGDANQQKEIDRSRIDRKLREEKGVSSTPTLKRWERSKETPKEKKNIVQTIKNTAPIDDEDDGKTSKYQRKIARQGVRKGLTLGFKLKR